MEELLNTLLKRGWKPFGKEYTSVCVLDEENIILRFSIRLSGPNNKSCLETMRTITAKESQLWQFVCENGMYKKEALGIYLNYERAKNVFYKIDQFDEEGDVIQTGDMEGDRFIHMSEPEYRVIESALCDEDKLEEFLLQNIKIEG